jgi:4-hydroxy-4-methyl-2-oxoglutarate aldolase
MAIIPHNLLAATLAIGISLPVFAQKVTPSPEEIKKLTPLWSGERSPDGRPRVSDELLARLKNISMEEAWGVLRNKGFHSQYEGNWFILHPDSAMTGRVVTAQYMPMRPDFHDLIKEAGKQDGRGQAGFTNSWPIEVLKNGDVYVADGYEKVIDGTLIGDNLGNSIYAKSKRGVIFYGGVRDVAGLNRIEGFNAWHKGEDPSFIKDMMLAGINVPIRIGRATVLPGDAVLAKKGGVVFVPAHLLSEVVITSEITALRDEFGILRLKEGKYSPGEIDSQWSDAIKKDFHNWVNNYPGRLPMSKKELDDYLKERNY